jgi:1-aminocyclopropane-1-carboxylate deaminase/D-cysteine desulfhydrase-like pyridoxal-dependent ACC family enzyme
MENNEIIYGKNAVAELLRSGGSVNTLYISGAAGGLTELITAARGRGVPVKTVPREKLDALCGNARHGGVAASVSAAVYADLSEVLERAEKPFLVIADGVEDPHNLGAIIRVAEGAGAHGLIIPKRHGAGLTQTVYKTSAGAAEHVLIARVTNLSTEIEKLKKRGVWAYKGNQILNDLLGAEVRFVDSDRYDDVYAEMDRIADDLAAKGHRAYQIPVGGSTALGSLGYALAIRELAEQATDRNITDIVCTAGSGGTLAGVLQGAKLYMPQARVTGVVIDPDDYGTIVSSLVNEAAEIIDSEIRIEPSDVLLYDCYGAGYAIPSTPGMQAIRYMAAREGIILDPVYTGKAFAGLLELAKSGYFQGRGAVAFIHSGGAGGVFAVDMQHPQD